MFARSSWLVSCLAVAFVALGVDTARGDEPKKGLHVGDVVPTSSMRCVVGAPKLSDRNTCLAGFYRGNRTFSVYVKSIDEPHLNSVLKKLDGLLKERQEVRGYLLLLKGSQFDMKLKETVRAWAKELPLSHLDVAIAVGAPEGIEPESSIVVVYSDKRLVKFHQSFAADQLTEQALDDLAKKLDELAR